MDLPYHALSRKIFANISSGGGGRDAVRELSAAEYSKHLVLLIGVLNSAQGSDQYQLAKTGYELLAKALQANRAAAEDAIRYPAVGVWARRTIQACRGGAAIPGAEPGELRAVAAAAAIRAEMTAEIDVPVRAGRVILPSLGVAIVPGDIARIRTAKGKTEVGPVELPPSPHQDGPGWLGLHRVRAGSFDVLIDDLDPFRMPDLPDLASRVTVKPWDASLSESWDALESSHPAAAAEVAEAVSVIVPRRSPRTGVVSTSSPWAFGAVGMSCPPDPITGAETFAHEIQHLKLGALQHIVALAQPDDGRRYYAPWRDDPRPLSGLLQGAYAYLGVTGFWRRQRHLSSGPRRADTEYVRWRQATALGIETLRSSGRLTAAGLDFVSGMASMLASWQDDPVPAVAQTEARRAADAHLARWEFANGPLTSR